MIRIFGLLIFAMVCSSIAADTKSPTLAVIFSVLALLPFVVVYKIWMKL